MSVGPFGDRQFDQFAELSARVLNMGGNRHLIYLKKYSLCMAAPKETQAPLRGGSRHNPAGCLP